MTVVDLKGQIQKINADLTDLRLQSRSTGEGLQSFFSIIETITANWRNRRDTCLLRLEVDNDKSMVLVLPQASRLRVSAGVSD